MAGFLGVPRERLPIAVAMVLGLVAVLSWLQGRFDTSDVKEAIALAMGHRPQPRGPSLFEALAARDEGEPRCDGRIVSAFFGDVRVSCANPGRPDVRYDFRVLLGGKRPPKGESAAARTLLAELARAPADPGGGGR
jgi:hypothetical protein